MKNNYKYITILSLLFIAFGLQAQRLHGTGLPGQGDAYAGETYTYTMQTYGEDINNCKWTVTNGTASPHSGIGHASINITWKEGAKSGKIVIEDILDAFGNTVKIEETIQLKQKSGGGTPPPNPNPNPGGGEEKNWTINIKFYTLNPYAENPTHTVKKNENFVIEGRSSDNFDATRFNWSDNGNMQILSNGKYGMLRGSFPSSGTWTVNCEGYNPISPHKIAVGKIDIHVLPSTISGPTSVCKTADYEIKEKLPDNCTIRWEVGERLKIVSGQGTTKITVENTNQKNDAYIHAYINGHKITKEVAINTPNVSFLTIKSPATNVYGEPILYTGDQRYNEIEAIWKGPEEILSYEWEVASSYWEVIPRNAGISRNPVPGQYVYFRPLVYNNSSGMLSSKIKVTNRCGTSLALVGFRIKEGHP